MVGFAMDFVGLLPTIDFFVTAMVFIPQRRFGRGYAGAVASGMPNPVALTFFDISNS
jgi:hypothetical protein